MAEKKKPAVTPVAPDYSPDPLSFVMDRVTIWKSAHTCMSEAGINEPHPEDVLALAEWLSGDNLPDVYHNDTAE